MRVWQIIEDDLSGPEIRELLDRHFSAMLENSPAGSAHFLNLENLGAPHIRFWSIHADNMLAGCGALRIWNGRIGEIKSMRTADRFLRQGAASHMLDHIIAYATRHGLMTLYLETGTGAAFAPAQALYEQRGFRSCAPFANYQASPHNRFFEMNLRPEPFHQRRKSP